MTTVLVCRCCCEAATSLKARNLAQPSDGMSQIKGTPDTDPDSEMAIEPAHSVFHDAFGCEVPSPSEANAYPCPSGDA